MAMVSPSLLSADFTRLGADSQMVLDAGAEMLHYDVMDGHFVPNISFGVPVLKSLHAALPNAFYDVHLMIADPYTYAEPFAKAGASLITFHIEKGREANVLRPEYELNATIEHIRKLGCKVGLSVKPGTPAEAVFPWLDKLDLVLVMSVEPGFGGQKFMPQALDKIALLRAEIDRCGLECLVEVDGGIGADAATGKACADAGADVLVAGSAVFGAADPAAVIAALHTY